MAVTSRQHASLGLVFILVVAVESTFGAVLPEERADALYHSYDGGGVQIDGPSILVLKSFGKSTSVSGNYYVDNITSASIDVVATASEYEEERTEKSAGATYLHNKTIMRLAYTNSDENDFVANSAHFSFSQDVFGDLTTVSMGYSRGWDDVYRMERTSDGQKRRDPTFKENADRQNYRLGLSQVLSKNLITNFNWETITDEGYLNNPYRQVRYRDPDSGRGFSYQSELYPNTRTSNAASIQARYFLAYRAALHGLYRYFNDTWSISAHTFEIGYTHPYKKSWLFDLRYRYYTQTAADFYQDLFDYRDATNFRARDKELSTFVNHTVGVGVAYELPTSRWRSIKKGSINFKWDYIYFDYDDFRDITQGGEAGQEPLYNFDANVLQLFLSIWY